MKMRARALLILETDIDPKAKWGKKPGDFIELLNKELSAGPAKEYNPKLKVLNTQSWETDENQPAPKTKTRAKTALKIMQEGRKLKPTRNRRTKAA